MSYLLDAIRSRRSVRKYQDRAVPQEIVRKLLESAAWAPSAHNAQPWRFVVLVEGHIKRRLAEVMAEAWATDMREDGVPVEPEKFRSRVERFANAPLLILACLTMEGMLEQNDAERKDVERDLAMQSLAAAVENLLLVGSSLGLGACWFCAPAFCKEAVRKVMKIPKEVEPQGLIVLGYPDEEPVAPRRKTVGEVCFLNQWGTPIMA